MAIEERIILDSTINKKTADRITKLLDRYFKKSGFDTSYISYEFSNNGVVEITPSDKWVDEWQWVNPYAIDASEDGEELEPEEELEAEEEVGSDQQENDGSNSKKPERRDDFDARKLEAAAVIDTFIEKLTSEPNPIYNGRYRTIKAGSWESLEEGLGIAVKKIKITEKVDMRAVINDPTYIPPRLASLNVKYVEKPTPAFKKTRKPAEDIKLVEPPRPKGRPAEAAKPQLPLIDLADVKKVAKTLDHKRPIKLTPKARALASGEPTFRKRNFDKVAEILGLDSKDTPKPDSEKPTHQEIGTKPSTAFPKEPPRVAAAINGSNNLQKRITLLKGVKLSDQQAGVIAANIDKYFKDRGVSVSGIIYKFGVTTHLDLKFIIIGDNIPSYDPDGTNTPFQIARRDLLTENGERILRGDFSTTGYSVSASTWKELLTGLNVRLEKAGKQVPGR